MGWILLQRQHVSPNLLRSRQSCCCCYGGRVPKFSLFKTHTHTHTHKHIHTQKKHTHTHTHTHTYTHTYTLSVWKQVKFMSAGLSKYSAEMKEMPERNDQEYAVCVCACE